MYDVKFEMAVSDAIEVGDIENVKKMLGDDVEKINMLIPRGNWLNIAVSYQQMEIVKYLLDIGIDRNLMSRNGNSLVNAARTGNIEMIQFLIQSGVDITCTLDNLNPIVPAVQSDRLEVVKYLLEKEKELLSNSEYEELIKIVVQNAEIFSCKDILDYFGVKKVVKNKKLTKPQKNKLTQLVKQGMRDCFAAIKAECVDEKLYILSVEADEDLSAIYVYMNTEENLQQQLNEADEKEKEDIYYYRYCEDEWDVLEESPQYFTSVTNYIKEKDISNDDRMMWYSLIVDALCELREEKFFEQEYKNEILLTIYGHDTCSEEEVVELFTRMNVGKDIDDYIENIKRFY